MRAGRTILAVALSALLSAGCGGSDDLSDIEAIEAIEATLQEHYVQPLSEAGITSTVERACRYSGRAEGPWILMTDLHLDAPAALVLQALQDQGVQVKDQDQDQPMSVQQVPGHPDEGWDGTVTAAGSGSTSSLRRYSVVNTPAEQAQQWSTVCPETLYTDLRDPAPEPSRGAGV